MPSTLAIVRRILTQFALDKRTLALLFVAPLVVLWLLSVILGADTVGPKIATVNLPTEFQTQLEQIDARITEADADEASALLADNDVAAVLSMEGDRTLKVELEGADSTKSAAVLAICAEALGEGRGEAADEMEATIADKRAEVEEAIDGANQQREEARTALEGVTISMPAEARAGLAEALGGLFDDDAALSFSTEDLSMNASNYLPIEDMETAYLHGNEDWRMFDCYGPVFIGFPNEGNVGLVVFTCITMAMVSVALGFLVSGLATTPFQVIQLILLFVVPQILLCGANLATVGFDLAILWGFLALFFTLAAASFRKKRA